MDMVTWLKQMERLRLGMISAQALLQVQAQHLLALDKIVCQHELTQTAVEESWQQTQSRVASALHMVSDKIKFSVQGTVFATTRQRLLASGEDSFFHAMLTTPGRWMPNTDGYYVIERDPFYFGIILDYLRSGRLPLQKYSIEQLQHLTAEFDFYQLALPINVPRVPPFVFCAGQHVDTHSFLGGDWRIKALHLATHDTIITNHGKMVGIFTNDGKIIHTWDTNYDIRTLAVLWSSPLVLEEVVVNQRAVNQFRFYTPQGVLLRSWFGPYNCVDLLLAVDARQRLFMAVETSAEWVVHMYTKTGQPIHRWLRSFAHIYDLHYAPLTQEIVIMESKGPYMEPCIAVFQLDGTPLFQIELPQGGRYARQLALTVDGHIVLAKTSLFIDATKTIEYIFLLWGTNFVVNRVILTDEVREKCYKDGSGFFIIELNGDMLIEAHNGQFLRLS